MIKSALKRAFRMSHIANGKSKGFTLIELLIVIAILGILAAAVVVAINPAKRSAQARDAGRKNDIGSISTAAQAYYTTPGQGLYAGAEGCGPNTGGFTSLTGSGDLKNVPDDPKTTPTDWSYCLELNTDSSEGAIWATLENPLLAANNRFCWQSTIGKAIETSLANCTAGL